MSRFRLFAPLLALFVAGSASLPDDEGLPECRGPRSEKPVVLTHLGGCQAAPDVRGLDAVGNGGDGWSIAVASRTDLSRLRAGGCPSAVLCSDGNAYAALVRRSTTARLRRRIDAVKVRARPRLRPGVDGGPLLHSD